MSCENRLFSAMAPGSDGLNQLACVLYVDERTGSQAIFMLLLQNNKCFKFNTNALKQYFNFFVNLCVSMAGTSGAQSPYAQFE